MGLFNKPKNPNPKLQEIVKFIENAGGCIITKSVLEGTSQVKWVFREESVNPVDNGWRVYGDSDDEDYISQSDNHCVVDFNTLANIEPLVLDIYNLPVGTDLEFNCDSTGRYFIDSNTGERLA